MIKNLLTATMMAVCVINPTTFTVKAEEEPKLPAPAEPEWDPHFELVPGDGYYWYEYGKLQGAEGDPLNIWDTQYDKTERGREIYDPATDAWYWLDACFGGRKAESKECWFPYVYQDEEAGSTNGKWVRYDSNGSMVKGFCVVKNEDPRLPDNLYYYDYITGAMAKGIWTFKDLYSYEENEAGSIIYIRLLFDRSTGACPLTKENIETLKELNVGYWELYFVDTEYHGTLSDWLTKYYVGEDVG